MTSQVRFVAGRSAGAFLKCKKHFSGFCCTFSVFTIRLFILQFRVFTAPFHRVEFADFWLADQLNSLVFTLMDLEYLFCFYIFELQWSNSKGLLPDFGGEAFCSAFVYWKSMHSRNIKTYTVCMFKPFGCTGTSLV